MRSLFIAALLVSGCAAPTIDTTCVAPTEPAERAIYDAAAATAPAVCLEPEDVGAAREALGGTSPSGVYCHCDEGNCCCNFSSGPSCNKCTACGQSYEPIGGVRG